MDCRCRRDSLAFGTQENDSDYPLGMERCLKKLVLEAEGMGLGTRKERLEAAGSISEKIWGWQCSVEGQPVYTHESEGQKTNSGLITSAGGPKN